MRETVRIMRSALIAIVLSFGAVCSAAPACAEVAEASVAEAPPSSARPFLADARAQIAALDANENAQHPACNVAALRAGMYAAQAVDAFATAAAVRGRATSRTAYGTSSSAASYLVTQAAFDVVVGALTRRASCGTKAAISAVVGGSALFNASKDGIK